MSFRIIGLDPAPFVHLYGMSDAELAHHGARRHVTAARPGVPDRVEMRDLEIGETALLVNYVHQPADNPYRASHAIFVREGAIQRYDAVGQVPELLRVRTLSLRAFDDDHMMRDARLVDGRGVEDAIGQLLADPQHAYIQVHYATRGCYAARVERA